MNPRHKPFLWAGGAVIAGALVIVAIRGLGDRGPVPVMPQDVAAHAPASGLAPGSGGHVANEESVPWQLAQPGRSSTTDSVQRQPSPDQAPAIAADTARAISDIRTRSQENIRNTDELLRQLDAWEKAGQAPAEVSLDALRNNLVVARRAQLLAQELAESTQQADSPQRRQRHASIVEELQQLQHQLRYDVSTAGNPPASAMGQAR